jgi:hypothetical protein
LALFLIFLVWLALVLSSPKVWSSFVIYCCLLL